MSLTPEQRKELRQTLTTFDDHDRIDRGLAVALDDIDRLENLLKRAIELIGKSSPGPGELYSVDWRKEQKALLKEWRSRPK